MANTAVPNDLIISHTVVNMSVVNLGNDTEVYGSAGCDGVEAAFTVGELLRLLAPSNFTIVDC